MRWDSWLINESKSRYGFSLLETPISFGLDFFVGGIASFLCTKRVDNCQDTSQNWTNEWSNHIGPHVVIEFAVAVLSVGILILGRLKHHVNRCDCHVDSSGAKKCIAEGNACHDNYDCQSLYELVVRDLGTPQFNGVVSKSQDHCGEKHGPESLPVTLEAFSISIGVVYAEVFLPSW